MIDHRAELVNINSLKHFKGNAKQGDIETIRKSLRVNGQYRPIVVRTETMEVLAGNQTMEAAIAENYDQIWVTWVSCDEQQAQRINLVDNRSPELGGYDADALMLQLQSLPDLNGTGWNSDDLAELASRVGIQDESGSGNDQDQEPEEQKAAVLVICQSVVHQSQVEQAMIRASQTGNVEGLSKLLVDTQIKAVAI